jgi:hypothetical protein
MVDLPCGEEVYSLIGAAFEVYNELGSGFWSGCINKLWNWNWQIVQFPLE